MNDHRSPRRAVELPPFVARLARDLRLDPDRDYDLAALRVSARGRLDKLEDQEDTGIGVYADNPDGRPSRDSHPSPANGVGTSTGTPT